MLILNNLTTEYLTNPISVPLRNVRFGWNVFCDDRNQKQLAYRIIVANDTKTVWDSGKVFSSNTAGIVYSGEPLQPRTRYFWQVKIYTHSGEESSFSPIQTFETCLSSNEWESAQFIGAQTQGLPILRKTFSLPNQEILRARVYVCGLGYYELSLNGKPVGKDLLNPMVTRYHKHYLFNAYDITHLLNKGENVFGVMLGNGYYSMHGNGVDWQKDKWANAPWTDKPKCKLLAFITYFDGTETVISTEESWKATESPLRVDEAYYGEDYDARLELRGWNQCGFDDEKWQSVERLAPPAGKAELQLAEACAVIKSIHLKQLSATENEYLFDTEKMIAGWVRLSVSGDRGDEIEVSYSEWLNESGKLDDKGLLGVWDFQGRQRKPQTDYFTLKGEDTEVFAPHFHYKGFRYVRIRIRGNIKIKGIVAEIVHADLKQTGFFACSDERVNQLHEACENTLLNNLHSYPSDTPVYEKLGYLADGYITQPMAHFNFDSIKYYEKWAMDILDQVKPNGYIEQTAPMWDEDKENAPEWSVAVAIVPYQIYRETNDSTLLLKSYEKAKKVFAYQMKQTNGYIATSMWGDHASIGNNTIKEISATASLFVMANILAETALLQGKRDEYTHFTTSANLIKSAFNTRFYDEEKGYYLENKNAGFMLNAQVIPCGVGLANGVQKHKIGEYLQSYENEFYGGIFSVKYAFQVLTEMGQEERLYDWITKNSPPSWGYWLSFGDGSLWEQWINYTRSRNHHMFGSVDEWLYKTLAGLELTDTKTLKIKPFFHKELQWVKASIAMPSGVAVCSWVRHEKGIRLNIEVPFNVQATIYLPSLQKELTVGSGKYEFEIV